MREVPASARVAARQGVSRSRGPEGTGCWLLGLQGLSLCAQTLKSGNTGQALKGRCGKDKKREKGQKRKLERVKM